MHAMTPIGHRFRSAVSRPVSRSNRRQLLGRTLALGSALPVLAATGQARTVRAQSSTFTLAANWSPGDVDPHSGYDPGSGLILAGVYESLIRQVPGETVQFEPWLAESWEANADYSSWTFHLREGVTFQDGSRLTAEAARASFVRQMTLNLAPANVLGRFISSPDQIVAVDAQTLRFDLGRPRRSFEVAMAAPFGTSIMNVAAAMAHEVEGDLGHAWCQSNTEGMGTGPYRLTEYDPATGAVLERFDGYWGGWTGNHFDTVIIRVVAEGETRRELIERGDVDLVENIALDAVAELASNPDLVVDRQTDLTVRYLAITQAEPFLQPEARQALCWAFPYEEVLQGVFLGNARLAQGAVSKNCAGFSPTTPAYTTDLEKAKALLAQAGIPAGTKVQTLSTNGAAIVQTIAELFQRNLAEVGLDLEIETMDYGSYLGLVYGDLPADERPLFFPSFWGPDYDDAWSQLWPLTSCDAWSSGNAGHYCNDRVDELLEIANDAADQDTYLAALAEAQEIVAYDDPAGIYFALPEWITVLRRDIGGFELHPVVSSRLDYYRMHRTA
jgi:peptide/nickel transport system substrate-binding protein